MLIQPLSGSLFMFPAGVSTLAVSLFPVRAIVQAVLRSFRLSSGLFSVGQCLLFSVFLFAGRAVPSFVIKELTVKNYIV